MTDHVPGMYRYYEIFNLNQNSYYHSPKYLDVTDRHCTVCGAINSSIPSNKETVFHQDWYYYGKVVNDCPGKQVEVDDES